MRVPHFFNSAAANCRPSSFFSGMGSAAISDLVVCSSEVKSPESILKWKKISFVCLKKEDVGGGESEAPWISPSTQPGFTSHCDILRETVKQEATQVKNKRRGFSFALRKEEIEEDVFAVTGLKPVRMPKKRPKKAQNEIDFLFTGSWLEFKARLTH